MINSDFIIVLAWPEGETTAAGAWYDSFCATNGKYRVGHSALILINSKNKELFYFDFGRYHTPPGFGRVRDKETDPDISIPISAKIEENKIMNIEEILLHTANKEANHGEGKLYYKIFKNISFKNGRKYAKINQKRGLISFGPFSKNSLNCGRFIYNVMRKSNFSTIGTYKFIFNDFLLRIPILRNLSIKYYFKN